MSEYTETKLNLRKSEKGVRGQIMSATLSPRGEGWGGQPSLLPNYCYLDFFDDHPTH